MVERRVGRLIAAGRTSDVFEFGTDAAVKVPRPGVPSHWMGEEARLTVAVRTLGAAAHEVIDLVDIDGRESIVFRRVDGPPLWEQLVTGERSVEDVAALLVDVQRSVWSLGLTSGIDGFVDRLSDKIGASTVLTSDEQALARQVAQGLPGGAALLHGDLHPGNILMSGEGPVLIDWFDAAIGHPVADVVRTSLLIRPLAAGRPHLQGATPDLLRRLHQAYANTVGTNLSHAAADVLDWEVVIAAGRLTEAAELDDAPLIDLWRNRTTRTGGELVAALSAAEN